MADYYPLITGAVAALEPNTPETRRALYDRARAAQWGQLRSRPEDFGRERVILEDAISRAERVAIATDHAVSDSDIVSDYSKFLEVTKTRPDWFYDVRALPHPKQAIVAAIERQIVLTAPDALAKWLAAAPMWLWNFLEGIGPNPVPLLDPEPTPDNATPEDIRRLADRVCVNSERFKRFEAIAKQEAEQIEQRINAALWIRKERLDYDKDFDRERLGLEEAFKRSRGAARASRIEMPQSVQLLPPKKETTREKVPIAFTTGMVLIGLASISAIALFVYTWGDARAVVRLQDYMELPVDIAFIACIVIFLPLLLFRKTRGASAIGFLVSSYVFGASTWLAGVLNSYIYFGWLWLFVSLFFAGIGPVPLGIFGAIIHSNWIIAGSLLASLVLTFGTRWIGLGIGAWATNE